MSASPTETTTTLQALAASIATADGAKALLERAFNANGQKYVTRNGLVRAHNAEITYRGTPMSVDYSINDVWMSNTDIDAGEQPYVEKIRAVWIGGVECLRIFDEEQVADLCDRIEISWRREV